VTPLDAVLRDPEDLRARRVYADWLLERGDPRGDHIRLSCDAVEAAPPHWQPRLIEDRWLDSPQLEADDICATLANDETLGHPSEMRAGFLEHVGGKALSLLPKLDQLAAKFPLRSVELHYSRHANLRPQAALAQIRRLTLHHMGDDASGEFSPDFVAALPRQLERLALRWAGPVQTAILHALERVDDLSLSLNSNLASDIPSSLARTQPWTSLKRLSLESSQPRLIPNLPDGLRVLTLYRPNEPMLAALRRSPPPQLEWLGLHDIRVESIAIERALEALPSLVGLSLSFGGERTVGRSLLRTLPVKTLRSLSVRKGQVESLYALSKLPFEQLTSLDFENNRLGPRDCAALAAAPFFPSLRALALRGNETVAGASSLTGAALVHLSLSGQPGAAEELLESLPDLQSLDCGFDPRWLEPRLLRHLSIEQLGDRAIDKFLSDAPELRSLRLPYDATAEVVHRLIADYKTRLHDLQLRTISPELRAAFGQRVRKPSEASSL
jgi:uncharacterized protein (TIGR02996 family)